MRVCGGVVWGAVDLLGRNGMPRHCVCVWGGGVGGWGGGGGGGGDISMYLSR